MSLTLGIHILNAYGDEHRFIRIRPKTWEVIESTQNELGYLILKNNEIAA